MMMMTNQNQNQKNKLSEEDNMMVCTKKQKMSESESSSTNKSVYLCRGPDYKSWYRLGPLEGVAEGGTEVVPLPSTLTNFTCITCGSKVYCFGGGVDCDIFSPEATRDIFMFDPNLESESGQIVWKKQACKMDSPRFFPVLAVKDDLIYIFGTHVYTHPIDPWAEVYDTKSGQIYPLSNPPTSLSSAQGFSYPTVHGDTIYIGSTTEMFAYDIKLNLWEEGVLTHHPEFPLPLPLGNVVQDGILFTMCDGLVDGLVAARVAAYDFASRKFTFPVQGFEKILNFAKPDMGLPRSILNLGNGKLCLAFVTSFCILKNFPNSCSLLCLLPFEVTTQQLPDGSRSVTARVISVAYYPLFGAFFSASFAV